MNVRNLVRLLGHIPICIATLAVFSQARLVSAFTTNWLDLTFNAGGAINGPVYGLGVQVDGKLVIAGDFTSISGVAKGRIARLNIDGSLDESLNSALGANSVVHSVAVSPDGSVFVGGKFTSVDRVARGQLARFNADGSLDFTFNPTLGPNDVVYSIAAQADGKLLIGEGISPA